MPDLTESQRDILKARFRLCHFCTGSGWSWASRKPCTYCLGTGRKALQDAGEQNA